MENQIYGAELDLKIDGFKSKAREARQTAQQLGKELGRGVTAYDMKNAGYYVKDFNNELKDTSDEMGQVNTVSAKASVSIQTGFSKALRSLKRFALSLFGIRSMWALISRGASAYISQNEVLNQQIKITSFTLGATLAPVIEKVIDLAQYGVIIIAKLIEFFTGYNALAKVTAKNLKITSKEAKGMNKNLAGFDELTNLNPDTSKGLASGIGDQLKALNDFQEKVKKVEDAIERLKETKLGQFLVGVGEDLKKFDWKHPIQSIKDMDWTTKLFLGGAGLGLIGFFGGGGLLASAVTGALKTVGSVIGNIVDLAAKGAKALVDKVGLSNLATIGLAVTAATLTIKAAQKWKEVSAELSEQHENINDSLQSTKKTNENIVKIEDKKKNILLSQEKIDDNILKSYKDQVGDSLAIVKNAKETNTFGNKILGLSMKTATITASELETSQARVRTLYELYQQGKLDADQQEYVKQILLDQLHEYGEIGRTIGNNSAAYGDVQEKMQETRNILKDMGHEFPTLGEKFKSGFEKALDSVKNKAKTIFSVIGTLVSKLTGGLGELFSTITGTNIKELGKKLKTTVATKLATLVAKFNVFDVGTNYVPNDQLALIHKGEAVVPKKYNPAAGGGVNNNDDVVNAINVLTQTLINKNMNAYISRDDVGKASVEYINNKTRQLGESVIS